MGILTDLQTLLTETAEQKPVKTESKKQEIVLSDEMLGKISKLPPKDIATIATMLAERFPEVSQSTLENELPKVGEAIGEHTVRRVERRQNARCEDYWVVGMDNKWGRVTKTVTVLEEEKKYRVAWKSGARWCSVTIAPHELRGELAKKIGK